MTVNEHEEMGYITLKQASERFGYAPDYIGQLIRKGKIEGKQVYANIAWMTTEEAMEEYIAGTSAGMVSHSEKHPGKLSDDTSFLDRVMETLFSKRAVPVMEWALRIAFTLLVIIGLFVFYFLSISIDDRLAKNAEHALALRMETNARPAPASVTPHNPVAYGE